jgi:hypothetical protein
LELKLGVLRSGFLACSRIGWLLTIEILGPGIGIGIGVAISIWLGIANVKVFERFEVAGQEPESSLGRESAAPFPSRAARTVADNFGGGDC